MSWVYSWMNWMSANRTCSRNQHSYQKPKHYKFSEGPLVPSSSHYSAPPQDNQHLIFFFRQVFNMTLCNQNKPEFVHLMCSKSVKTVTELLKWRKVGCLLVWCQPGEWGADPPRSWTPPCLASERFEGQNLGQGSPEEVDIHEWRTVRSC